MDTETLKKIAEMIVSMSPESREAFNSLLYSMLLMTLFRCVTVVIVVSILTKMGYKILREFFKPPKMIKKIEL